MPIESGDIQFTGAEGKRALLEFNPGSVRYLQDDDGDGEYDVGASYDYYYFFLRDAEETDLVDLESE